MRLVQLISILVICITMGALVHWAHPEPGAQVPNEVAAKIRGGACTGYHHLVCAGEYTCAADCYRSGLDNFDHDAVHLSDVCGKVVNNQIVCDRLFDTLPLCTAGG